jgi:hypothetical protein
MEHRLPPEPALPEEPIEQDRILKGLVVFAGVATIMLLNGGIQYLRHTIHLRMILILGFTVLAVVVVGSMLFFHLRDTGKIKIN